MAQSGRVSCADGCLLSGVKRTSRAHAVTSAYDPKRKSRELTSLARFERELNYPGLAVRRSGAATVIARMVSIAASPSVNAAGPGCKINGDLIS
jgi:hypothetical protein